MSFFKNCLFSSFSRSDRASKQEKRRESSGIRKLTGHIGFFGSLSQYQSAGLAGQQARHLKSPKKTSEVILVECDVCNCSSAVCTHHRLLNSRLGRRASFARQLNRTSDASPLLVHWDWALGT